MELSSASQAALDIISVAFQSSGLSVSNYVITLLEHQMLEEHPCTVDLINNADKIIEAFSYHPRSRSSAFNWAAATMKKKYSESIKSLISNEEWHFNASHASAKQLEDFRIEDMALKMKELAPDLWLMLDILLMGTRIPLPELLSTDHDGDHIMSATEDSENIDTDSLNDHSEKLGKVDKNIARREALCTIVCYFLLSSSQPGILRSDH